METALRYIYIYLSLSLSLSLHMHMDGLIAGKQGMLMIGTLKHHMTRVGSSLRVARVAKAPLSKRFNHKSPNIDKSTS